MATPNFNRGNETLSGKKGFKQFLDEKTIKRLDTLAPRYKRRNKQQVIEEIIYQFLPAWEKAQKLTPEMAQTESV